MAELDAAKVASNQTQTQRSLRRCGFGLGRKGIAELRRRLP